MTMDNGMDVSPSWQELKEERDALAAQLRSVQSAFDKVVSYGRFDNGTTNVSLAVLRNVQAALDADPGASLARIKAKWQAEALEQLAEDFNLDASSAHDNEYHDAGDAMEDAADKALERANELRRQAEGGSRP